MPCSSELTSRSLPQARHLRRRLREQRQRTKEQVDRGRPDAASQTCGHVIRTKHGCCGGSLIGTVRNNDSNFIGFPTTDIVQQFADETVGSLWPDECLDGRRGSKHRAIESLASSPPTRFAFWQFQETCRKQGLDPTEKHMRAMLASLLSEPGQQMPRTEWLMSHETNPESREPTSSTDQLRNAASAFVVSVEAWRLSHGHFRDLGVEGQSEAGELPAALLLQLWLMDREGCFVHETACDERRRAELWQAWLDEYPLEEAEDEGATERQSHLGLGMGAGSGRGVNGNRGR